jgi:transposase InsO family protein
MRDAQVKLDMWRRYWNQERLHLRLDYVPPDEFAAKWVELPEAKTENDLRSLALTGS